MTDDGDPIMSLQIRPMSDSTQNRTQDLHVVETRPLVTPRELKTAMPSTPAMRDTVVQARQTIVDILEKRDPRMLVVIGPCSMHDEQQGIEYANRLAKLAKEVEDRLFLVMRLYFEKPRTTIGWKGLINDPHLNNSYDITTGLRTARHIFMVLANLGLPAGTEMLDPIVPQYTAELVSWSAIGARTTESQTHREMASGLSMPVGFKNGTEGNLDVALNAMQASHNQQHFLGIDQEGRTCIIKTAGNPHGHMILRGGREKPNYDAASVEEAQQALEKAGLPPVVMVDCSHANSRKDFHQQPVVCRNVVQQRAEGNDGIIGVMIESNIHEGNQKLGDDPSQLQYGVSITDACISWETTEDLLREMYEHLPCCERKKAEA